MDDTKKLGTKIFRKWSKGFTSKKKLKDDCIQFIC